MDGERQGSCMRVVVCWQGISGYMAACWRALAAHKDIQLSVLHAPNATELQFDANLLAGVDASILTEQENVDTERLVAMVKERRPDVVVVSGWAHPVYRQLPFRGEFASLAFVMTMDTPLKMTFKQRLARLKVGRYLD